jgi:hypothetical protein
MTDRQQRSRTIWRTLIRPLLILALFVLFVVVWWKVPPALYRQRRRGDRCRERSPQGHHRHSNGVADRPTWRGCPDDVLAQQSALPRDRSELGSH